MANIGKPCEGQSLRTGLAPGITTGGGSWGSMDGGVELPRDTGSSGGPGRRVMGHQLEWRKETEAGAVFCLDEGSQGRGTGRAAWEDERRDRVRASGPREVKAGEDLKEGSRSFKV